MSDDPSFQSPTDLLNRALAQLVSRHPAQADSVHPDPLALSCGFPEDGMGESAALEELASTFFPASARLGHPGYFAHMDPPTPWVSWVGELWSAACNQNLLHLDTGAGARELEQLVISWLSPWFGMNGGHLVPGSSIANITALWAARELKRVDQVLVSDKAHLSIRKAASLLGLKLHEVPVDDHHRLRPDALPEVDPQRSVLVITAGTVAAGAVDPLDVMPEAAWRHVDAAWAGPLRLTRYANRLDGVDRADSVAVSAHKWLFQPKENALVLFRSEKEAHEALSFGGSYLAVPNVGLLGSHGSAALPLAATLMAWGRRGLTARIEHCMELSEALATRVKAEPELELFDHPVTGVTLWRPVNSEPACVRNQLEDAFVALADVGGETWFRSVAANPMAEPDRVVEGVLSALARCRI